jgi:7-cyano-7-deazaguanine synthase
MMKKKAVAIVSGGLDSVTLAYLLASEGWALHLVAFDYGQRHAKELQFAQQCAESLGAEYSMIDCHRLRALLRGSALTDDIAVPHGHYAAPSMAVTIVPNRNAIMLSVAYAAAVVDEAEIVATGIHAGDHFIYPDCRPEFATAFDIMQKRAVEGCGHPDLQLHTPFVLKSKSDIVRLGRSLRCRFNKPGVVTKAAPFIAGNVAPAPSARKRSRWPQ